MSSRDDGLDVTPEPPRVGSAAPCASFSMTARRRTTPSETSCCCRPDTTPGPLGRSQLTSSSSPEATTTTPDEHAGSDHGYRGGLAVGSKKAAVMLSTRHGVGRGVHLAPRTRGDPAVIGKVCRLQQVERRFPVVAGCLHHHPGHSDLAQPVAAG